MNILFIIFLTTLLTVNFMFTIIPYISRKTEQFGVSIPSELYKRKDIKSLRKSYVKQMMMLNICFFAIFIFTYFLTEINIQIIGFITIVILYFIVSFFIYLKFHRKMKK